MKLCNLIKVGVFGSRKRRGRGQGTGLGGTAGRGHKGGNARSGYSPAPCCSGIPYYRRLPKRGFKNSKFTVRFAEVGLDVINELAKDLSEIDRNVLLERGVIRANEGFIKVLGGGTISKSVKVIADRFSAGAKEKIQAAGGTVEELMLG